MDITKLKPYPLNLELFDDLPKDDYNALKKDIAENGIKVDLHVKEDGTILCGHQRWKVAKELGLTDVPVKIVTPDDDEEYVIKDNLLRRQLVDEDRANLFYRLADKYAGRHGGDRRQERHDVVIGSTSELLSQEVYGTKDKARSIERWLQYAKIIKEMPEIKGQFESMAGVVREYKKRKYLEERNENTSPLEEEGLLFHGDAIEKLKEIPDGFVDCVIIDPPYAINYVEQTNSGKDSSGRNMLISHNKNFEDSPDYVFPMFIDVCKELKRVCKQDAHLYVFFAMSNYDQFYKILNGYFIVDKIPLIWEKNNFPIGRDVQKEYMLCYEPIFYCRNSNKNRLLNTKASRNIIKAQMVLSKLHPTQKPVELCEYFIKNSTLQGEVVLDCFAGSGTTLVASKNLKRRYVGIEKDTDYFKIIQRRLQDEKTEEENKTQDSV